MARSPSRWWRVSGVYNPPAQNSLAYRIGTYELFLRDLLDWLPRPAYPDPLNPDRSLHPLDKLTTREPGDLAIAILDAWAMVGDVITFYQERNADEGFLRTATDFRSVVELARAIDYALDPGVAASATLAFTIDGSAANGIVTIPARTQVGSAPAQGQLPQIFETSNAVHASADWNQLRLLATQVQALADGATALVLAGLDSQLSPGDPLVLSDARGPVDLRLIQSIETDAATLTTRVHWTRPLDQTFSHPSVMTFRRRTRLFGHDAPFWSQVSAATQLQFGGDVPSPVSSVAVAADGKTVVSGHADGSLIAWDLDERLTLRKRVATGSPVLAVAFQPDGAVIAAGSANGLITRWDVHLSLLDTLDSQAGAVNGLAYSPHYATDSLLLTGHANGTALIWQGGHVSHTLSGHTGAVNGVAFSPDATLLLTVGEDRATIMWGVDGSRQQAYAGHSSAVLCVAFSPDYATDKRFASGDASGVVLVWQAGFGTPTESLSGPTLAIKTLAFSPGYATDQLIVAGSADSALVVWKAAVVLKIERKHIMAVNGIAYVPTSRGGAVVSGSADTTLVVWNMNAYEPILLGIQPGGSGEWPGFAIEPGQLDLASLEPSVQPGSSIALWRDDGTAWVVRRVAAARAVTRASFLLSGNVTHVGLDADVSIPEFDLRTTLVGLEAESLTLAAGSQSAPVPPCTLGAARNCVTLDRTVIGFRAGQLFVLSGELYDCALETGTGRIGTEVLALEGVGTDGSGHTILYFREELRSHYVRSSVVLNGNVAMATNGQTVPLEVLGSGDGQQTNQQFTLDRAPLTYVSDATARGSRGTLAVFVNGARWQEVPGFFGVGPSEQVYQVQLDSDGRATVRFGDGQHGARLPSGTDNVVAAYRVGLGFAGEVGAGALTQLLSVAPAISSVRNPLPAGGAAAPDTRDLARVRAPYSATTLGRIVSLADYDAYVRTFAGIGRARSALLWGTSGQVIHITVLGADGRAIPDDSALYHSLVAGIDAIREPAQPLVVQSGDDLVLAFNVAARVVVRPGYLLDPVRDAIHAALTSAFALDAREFGQGVAESEVLGVIQGVRGVEGVRVTALYTYVPPATPPSLHAYLAVARAHWDPTSQSFKPDHLLALNTRDGVELTLETQG